LSFADTRASALLETLKREQAELIQAAQGKEPIADDI